MHPRLLKCVAGALGEGPGFSPLRGGASNLRRGETMTWWHGLGGKKYTVQYTQQTDHNPYSIKQTDNNRI